MKVLVTGGTGAFGTAVCRQLARAGADPLAMARHEPAQVPAGVRFVAGDICDPDATARALTGCDAVVHLAWFMGVGAPADATRAVNLGGTSNLLDAMERTGCRRLVFTSSTTTYGTSQDHPDRFREDEALLPAPSFLYASQKAEVEALIAQRDLDAVVARVTVMLGRRVANEPAQTYAGPSLLDIGGQSVVQVVHQDDVGRFLERATLGTWRGTVNLASPGAVPAATAGEILERRVTRLPLGASLRLGAALNRAGFKTIDEEVARFLAFMPVADTTRLVDDWGFEPVWSQEEVLRDQARSASRLTYLVPGTRPLPRRRRLPWANPEPPDPIALRPGVAWRHAAPEELRGQFDTMIDPAHPLYSGTNLHEAFPGPMTPLSLDLSLHGMSAAIDGLVQLFGLRGEPAELLRIGIASFGHHVYTNVSAARLMADVVPGATVEEVDRMFLGVDGPPAAKARLGPREALGAARLAGRVGPRLVGYRAEVDRIDDEARRAARVDPSLLADDALLSHLALVHDLVCQAWNVSSTGNFLLSGVSTELEGHDGDSEFAGATALRGVHRLAALVQHDEAARAVVDALEGTQPPDGPDEILARVRERAPGFAAVVEDVLADCGHRGPGETELANEVFADRPDLLLDVVRRAGSGAEHRPRPSSPRRRSPKAALARRIIDGKERARDAGVRLTHAFRIGVRERGRRLHAAGALAAPDDVVYLTYEELLSRTPPTPTVLAERRAERARLATYRMPLTFEGTWQPRVDEVETAVAGEILRGVPAVAGRYEGLARVMTAATDDIEPGEVLVAATTDVGWTPWFALSGAVVTDVGGVASHAAIVAREHGLPSVVGTGDATRRLRSGMRVRVDGAAGTVEVLDPTAAG